ncbi:MAG: hypothetical protein IT438_13590 [Phycisphaerales bacterium]|nr:hypothetical protein [Phycisphaerales bacterium]
MTIRRPAFREIAWAAVGCGLFTSVACHTDRQDDVSHAALEHVPFEVLPPHVLNPVLITITAASLIADGVPGNGVMMDQDFALVGYNLFQPQEPVEPLRSPSTPGSLSP